MARNVTYFPIYSQDENVVTNAVLILLSNVARLAPDIFQRLLTSLTNQDSYTIGPVFQNQITAAGASSILDASITQESFKIYIETKLDDRLDETQIERHFKTIQKKNNRDTASCVLLGLTRTKLSTDQYDALSAMGRRYRIPFFGTTFYEIADILEDATAEFRLNLNQILDEYRAFLQERKLVPMSLNRLLINPCGQSYKQNAEFHIYHDQPYRSKVYCKYLGIYKDKTVSLIGRVRLIVTAEIKNNRVEVIEQFPLPWEPEGPHALNNDEKTRILNNAESSAYRNLANQESRYYLVDKFVPTDFRKISRYGIQGHRYFTLAYQDTDEPGIIPDVFKNNDDPPIEQIAEALKAKTWE